MFLAVGVSAGGHSQVPQTGGLESETQVPQGWLLLRPLALAFGPSSSPRAPTWSLCVSCPDFF